MTATKLQRLMIGAGASALGAVTLLVAGAGVASGHVTVSPGTAEAGSFAVLTFSVPHGCDGSGTTEVAIQIPEQTPSVTPTVNPNWDVEKVMIQLDEPIADAHGNELTERVGQVVYTAKVPLPDGLRDTFELSLAMPDTAGETLAFPVVQSCEQGEHAWVQLAADGQDPHELDSPSPLVTLTAATADDAHMANTGSAAAAADDGSNNAVAVAGLSVGILATAVGGTALVRTRRQS